MVQPSTLSSADFEAARERLMAIGGHPMVRHSSEHQPMRGDPADLAVLLNDSNYAAALLAAEEAERAYGSPFAVSPAGGPWVLTACCPAPELNRIGPRKGPKDSTHVPFYKSLPKFKRRR